MLGIDLVHIPEFQKQLDTGGKAFIQKVFGTNELKNNNTEHLAGLWAAKEAIIKTGTKPPENWTDIIISYGPNGHPRGKIGDQNYDISIAHHGEYAVAVAQKL